MGSGRVVGVDGAGKYGWVGVVVDADGFVAARLGTLTEIVEWAEPVEVVGVDIPIGLVASGPRQADLSARRLLRRRSSSVFAAPPADVLFAASYVDANETLSGRGAPMISRQAWALVPKIVEAAAVAGSDDRVFEVHPEVSFHELAGGDLRWSKKTWNGINLRRRLLAGAGIVVPDTVEDVGSAVADDVVDAAVVAWTARRIAAGTACSLPHPPDEVAGRHVAIWY